MVHVPHEAAATLVLHYTALQRTVLLTMARQALVNKLLLAQPLQQAVEQAAQAAVSAAPTEQQRDLLELRACFVTLWRRDSGELRGCRGECSAHQPLAWATGYMALAAAEDDPRFAAVTAAELPDLRIELSVLSPLYRIDPSAVVIGKHGLMIAGGTHGARRRGLLLPQVAVEHQMTREQFLEAVCWKAGLSLDAWQAADVTLWAFETESWAER
jgi:AmmeMemoRadiSam system protein A